MDPRDRLEAIRVVLLYRRMFAMREEAVGWITKKNRYKFGITQLTESMENPEIESEKHRPTARDMANLEVCLAYATNEVGRMRKTVKELESDLRTTLEELQSDYPSLVCPLKEGHPTVWGSPSWMSLLDRTKSYGLVSSFSGLNRAASQVLWLRSTTPYLALLRQLPVIPGPGSETCGLPRRDGLGSFGAAPEVSWRP
jgi:hypothetical protein